MFLKSNIRIFDCISILSIKQCTSFLFQISIHFILKYQFSKFPFLFPDFWYHIGSCVLNFKILLYLGSGMLSSSSVVLELYSNFGKDQLGPWKYNEILECTSWDPENKIRFWNRTSGILKNNDILEWTSWDPENIIEIL